MNLFLEAYNAIDKADTGRITVENLRKYMEENSLDEEFVDKWLTIFDPECTGIITLENFCQTLGLLPKNVRELRRQKSSSGCEIIVSNVTKNLEETILEELTKGLDRFVGDVDRLGCHLRKFLEEHYDILWHVFVVRGDFWIEYEHEPNYNFQFTLGPYTFIVWRTPDT